MKNCVKKCLCVLLSATVILSTVAMGFMSTASSSHYFDNANFVKITVAELEAMYDRDETFIFVLYASYLDECRDFGTNVIEKYWMNEYGATVYGVDVFDHTIFGNHEYDTYDITREDEPEYKLMYNYFHLPQFLQAMGDPRGLATNWFNYFLDVVPVEEQAEEDEIDFVPKDIIPLPVVGFVKSGRMMTFDRNENYSNPLSDSTFTVALFPQLNAVLTPVDDLHIAVSSSVFSRGYFMSSDFQRSYSQDSQLSGYQQHLLDINKAFFTYLGENPIIEVNAIPPGADIDPGESLQTLQQGTRAMHEHSYIGHRSSYANELTEDLYNFDGFGLDTSANDPYPDGEDDDYEDDYYDFSEDNINDNVIWTSSDPSKVTVDQNGKITAVSPFPSEKPIIITCAAEDKRLAPWLPEWTDSAISTTWYDQFEIRIVPHNWDIQVLPGNEATCQEPGIRTYTCTDEGCTFRTHPYTEVISSDDAHVPALYYTPVAGSAADCRHETDGEEELLCSICGTVLDTRAISWENAHVWQDEQITERTCTTDGYTVQKCSICGITKEGSGQKVFATGHTKSYVYVVGSEPTCTESGLEQQVCGVCGEVFSGTQRTAAPLGHEWGVEYTDANGDTVHDCIRCDITEKVKLSFWERLIAFLKELFAAIIAIFA